ncbi:MAG: hypothetical protein JSW73_05640 [Candidatus Woesearchaeota archaeon]|nr:MAG: hypothetical protein JSW73_05640 [Candidatus Woesearchaeota archaeon]
MRNWLAKTKTNLSEKLKDKPTDKEKDERLKLEKSSRDGFLEFIVSYAKLDEKTNEGYVMGFYKDTYVISFVGKELSESESTDIIPYENIKKRISKVPDFLFVIGRGIKGASVAKYFTEMLDEMEISDKASWDFKDSNYKTPERSITEAELKEAKNPVVIYHLEKLKRLCPKKDLD